MPECRNCGAVVSAAYVRVFTPEEFDAPRACPHCADKVRVGGTIRDARSSPS